VASASGNTAIAGTLAVTGATTATGAVTANNAAGITGRNTIKAFGRVVNGVLVGSFGVTSITDNGTTHTVTMSSARADTNYAVLLTGDRPNVSNANWLMTYTISSATEFTVHISIPSVGDTDPDSYSFMVLSNE
jgi:hypothetical protein